MALSYHISTMHAARSAVAVPARPCNSAARRVSQRVARHQPAVFSPLAKPIDTKLACAPAGFSPICSAATGEKLVAPGQTLNQPNVVYKFGGSSVRDAERMREVADIICSFPENLPIVVLSAMGKSTNLLLECGDLALTTPTAQIADLEPLRTLRKLHLDTCKELGVESSVMAEVEVMVRELTQLLVGISIMQDLTPRAKDSLVSFGERLSTRIFASFLRGMGVPSKQHDAWDLGMVTTDEFGNADVLYQESFPKIKANLSRQAKDPRYVNIVTGFLGRGIQTGAITTLGRGGSDLSATVLGAAMDIQEVQVWKDVDGVLTSDPRSIANTLPVNELTYEEATELAYFGAQVLHPQAMQPAIRAGSMAVRVKNSYNRNASGTVITSSRKMDGVLVTSIVLKNNVTLVDVVSTRMTGQYGFLSYVFEAFKQCKISVDVVATSEVSVSATLDPKKLNAQEGDLEQLQNILTAESSRGNKLATVNYKKDLAIVSLICNVERTSEILQRTFSVLQANNIKVQMMSQGASKTNISLVINQSEGTMAVQALHDEFFGTAAGTKILPKK